MEEISDLSDIPTSGKVVIDFSATLGADLANGLPQFSKVW